MPTKTQVVTIAWTIVVIAALMRIDDAKKFILNEEGFFG